ncbi:Uncharacterised protein [uncultured archaeon]|nr:Uncharacterised protein [uncultured archaeon]
MLQVHVLAVRLAGESFLSHDVLSPFGIDPKIQGKRGPSYCCSDGIGHRSVFGYDCLSAQLLGHKRNQRLRCATDSDNVLGLEQLSLHYLPYAVGRLLLPLPEHLVDMTHDLIHYGIDYPLGNLFRGAAQPLRNIGHCLLGSRSISDIGHTEDPQGVRRSWAWTSHTESWPFPVRSYGDAAIGHANGAISSNGHRLDGKSPDVSKKGVDPCAF